MTNDTETPPLWSEPDPKAGRVEGAVQRQLDKLRDLGYIEDHHAGLAELALETARDIDRSRGKGAPSGRANLLRVMNEVLDTLPHPEAASTDQLTQVVEAMRAGGEDDVVIDLEPLDAR